MISRQQVINRLRAANYTFKRRGERVEIWRQRGTSQRVDVPLRDFIDPKRVRAILAQAGLSPTDVEAFVKGAVKVDLH